jgi:hypothetical protein
MLLSRTDGGPQPSCRSAETICISEDQSLRGRRSSLDGRPSMCRMNVGRAGNPARCGGRSTAPSVRSSVRPLFVTAAAGGAATTTASSEFFRTAAHTVSRNLTTIERSSGPRRLPRVLQELSSKRRAPAQRVTGVKSVGTSRSTEHRAAQRCPSPPPPLRHPVGSRPEGHVRMRAAPETASHRH